MKSQPTKLTCLLVTASLALASTALAVDPPPDGGYPNGNTAEGEDALFSLTTGVWNTALGYHALYNNAGGFDNTATGYDALLTNTTGHSNTATGTFALYSNTTGFANTANGYTALAANTTGTYNTATGYFALDSSTTAHLNTAIGFAALQANNGDQNTAVGGQALLNSIRGSNNTGIGYDALDLSVSGKNNTAVGARALAKNGDGDANIALGYRAGYNLTTGDNNIDIGNSGVNGDAGVIRIGSVDSATSAYIAGISGVTVANGVGVIISSNGQLGTVTSSARYKEAIKPMAKASEALLSLQPVTFRYKKEYDPKAIPQFGLVAEQVAKVDPDLVARDEQGKPYTVRYEAVNAMLLNEFLKEHRQVEEMKAAITGLEETVAKQAALIEKVSARVETKEPAPRLVSAEE